MRASLLAFCDQNKFSKYNNYSVNMWVQCENDVIPIKTLLYMIEITTFLYVSLLT